jgi:hypothetical protein
MQVKTRVRAGVGSGIDPDGKPTPQGTGVDPNG